jgi:hypothetical protein
VYEPLSGRYAPGCSLAGMRRTTLAIALATGALAIPAVALAADGDDPAPSTAPVQQQPQQQPRDHDCPEGQDGGSSGSSETLL